MVKLTTWNGCATSDALRKFVISGRFSTEPTTWSLNRLSNHVLSTLTHLFPLVLAPRGTRRKTLSIQLCPLSTSKPRLASGRNNKIRYGARRNFSSASYLQVSPPRSKTTTPSGMRITTSSLSTLSRSNSPANTSFNRSNPYDFTPMAPHQNTSTSTGS